MKYYLKISTDDHIYPQPAGQKTILREVLGTETWVIAYCDFRPGRPDQWKKAGGYSYDLIWEGRDDEITPISQEEAAMILFQCKGPA